MLIPGAHRQLPASAPWPGERVGYVAEERGPTTCFCVQRGSSWQSWSVSCPISAPEGPLSHPPIRLCSQASQTPKLGETPTVLNPQGTLFYLIKNSMSKRQKD